VLPRCGQRLYILQGAFTHVLWHDARPTFRRYRRLGQVLLAPEQNVHQIRLTIERIIVICKRIQA
jgi:hypothetical protein